jgi:signal transduction histidine kinase
MQIKNINLEINVADNIIINADKFTVKTVIANIFNNAIKFTHPKGKIKINASRKGTFIEISIADNGLGISPEALNKLFLVEESISTSDTDNEKGTGLGLLLCKEFIDKNDGRIWVESELGIGSTFYFTIPIKWQGEFKWGNLKPET